MMKKRSGLNINKRKKRVLGKGLEALFPDIESVNENTKNYLQCDIEQIRPNRYQPRIRFSEDSLKELAGSIKEQGVIQPLVVRKDVNGYELVIGERRLRAAKMAGFKEVPVVVKKITDTDLLQMSIVENIHRENLNPVEEADAYYRLMTEFNMTQEQVAQRVGKSRPAVANFLRVRQLPEQIKESLTDGALSLGHARALLGAENTAQQINAWKSIISKSLSVRETEALIKRLRREKKKEERIIRSDDAYFADLADDLSRYFGTRVKIQRNGKRGCVRIEFYSDNDLNRLIGLFKQK